MSRLDPSTRSVDMQHMLPYWEEMLAVLGGVRELRKRNGSGFSPYLPKFSQESEEDYSARLSTCTITNFLSDTIETLASKPFTSRVSLPAESESRLLEWAEDVDGHGNDLHAFAAQWYYWGIAMAIDWVLVDYPPMPVGATIAEESQVAPYLVRIPATDVLDVRSVRLNSREILTHFRVRRIRREEDGFDIREWEQIWVYQRPTQLDPLTGRVAGVGPAVCEVWERPLTTIGSLGVAPSRSGGWEIVDRHSITIGVIPIIPFVTGRRQDAGSWRMLPPMEPALRVQLSHFQQENGLRHAQIMTCFPVLAGNGVTPDMAPDGTVKPLFVGPRSVLYAPPSEDGRIGGWQFIEPEATSLRFLAEQLERTENNGRELGRQPLTAKADNITLITTAYAGSKANTLSQAWALAFSATLRRAVHLAQQWMGLEPSAEVYVDTDFDEELLGVTDPKVLLELRQSGDISRETLWSELRRLRYLDEDFSAEEEVRRLESEPPPLALQLAEAAARAAGSGASSGTSDGRSEGSGGSQDE